MGKMTVATVRSFHVFIISGRKVAQVLYFTRKSIRFSKKRLSNFLLIDLILLAYDSSFPQGLLFLQKNTPPGLYDMSLFPKGRFRSVLGHYNLWVIYVIPAGAFFGAKNTPPGFFDMSLFPKGRFRSVLGHFGV